jgi:hypothetical protein
MFDNAACERLQPKFGVFEIEEDSSDLITAFHRNKRLKN